VAKLTSRQTLVIVHDVAATAIATVASFWLRFDTQGLADRFDVLLRILPGFLLYAAIFGFWFFQSLYMQGTLHYSALETGIAFVPMTVAVGTGATLAPRLAKLIGARWVLVSERCNRRR